MRNHSPLTPSIKTDTALNLVPPSEMSEHSKRIFDAVARRAYKIFESRSCVSGHDRDDWFQAESELLKPLKVHVRESDDHLIASAELHEVRPHEIKISVEPHHLRISGTVEAREGENSGESVMNSLRYSLQPAEQIFHVLELPVEVDPANAKATLEDCKLEIVMPKAVQRTNLHARAQGA